MSITPSQHELNILAALNSISTMLCNLISIQSTLVSLNSASFRTATVLEKIQAAQEAEKAEEEKSNRDGTWEIQWFVEVPPRRPFPFDSEEEAYEGARRAKEGLSDSTTVNVFCTEVKRYKREGVPSSNWIINNSVSGNSD